MEVLKAVTLPQPRRRIPAAGTGVDIEARRINGFVIAEAGPFISEGRGAFNGESLDRIVALMRQAEPLGTRSRFQHPGILGDGLGSFLGRVHNVRREGNLVRADLHFDPSASISPRGDLSGYLMALAASDPAALAASLVLAADQTRTPGTMSPPCWIPTAIMAADVVEIGDACPGGLLQSDPFDNPASLLGWCERELADAARAEQQEMADYIRDLEMEIAQ